jgi:hypothetical protein
LRVANGIENPSDLNYFGKLRENTLQKMRVATGIETSDSQNLWSGPQTDYEKYRTV